MKPEERLKVERAIFDGIAEAYQAGQRAERESSIQVIQDLRDQLAAEFEKEALTGFDDHRFQLYSASIGALETVRREIEARSN